MKCGKCVFFSPHISFPWVGYCPMVGRVVGEAGGCNSFREISLNELLNSLEARGCAYCITCRLTLTSREELEEHYRKGHTLSLGTAIDEEQHLETYVAD